MLPKALTHGNQGRSITVRKIIGLIAIAAFAGAGMLGLSAGIASAEYSFDKSWGGFGTLNGFFNYSVGIDSKDGYVYVADWGNNRVQKFTTEGGFVLAWGSPGDGPGQFNNPDDVAIDAGGNVYVADSMNHRIQKFTQEGVRIGNPWGEQGSGVGKFERPKGVAVSGGYVYVADWGNSRIQKFTLDGNYEGMWGAYGEGDGDFMLPQDVAASSDGYVYVADTGNHRIQKFDTDAIGGWAWAGKWGTEGYDNGRFRYPTGIDVSGEYVYVADNRNNRIQKFSRNYPFRFRDKWGMPGTSEGQFNEPERVDADEDGNVYVSDTLNHRVQKFEEVEPPPPPPIPSATPHGPGIQPPQALIVPQKTQTVKPSANLKFTRRGTLRLQIKAGGQARIKGASLSLRGILKSSRYRSAQRRRILVRLLKKTASEKARFHLSRRGTIIISAALKEMGDRSLLFKLPRRYLDSRHICKKNSSKKRLRLRITVKYTNGDKYKLKLSQKKPRKLCG